MKECETARSEELSWPEIATPQTKSTEQIKTWFSEVRGYNLPGKKKITTENLTL